MANLHLVTSRIAGRADADPVPSDAAPAADPRVPRRPLRICHVAYTFYENDNRVIRYAEALAELGHHVEVIALRRHGQARRGEANGVQVHRVQRRSINERSAASYLFKILWFLVRSTAVLSARQLRRPYDVVHVHNVPDFLVFAAILPKLMGARIVLDIHDILPELYCGKFGARQGSAVFRALLAVERFSCRFADRVIVANHLWHEKLVRRAVAPEDCLAIMNYPDLRLFKPAADGAKPAGVFVFLYPGTLNRHQGLDIAIRAFARARRHMPDAELRIYGEGPAKAELKHLIEECQVGRWVQLMDRVPLTDVARIMAAADVGVVPKRADGFGNEAFSTKTLEFMACGVPVIVSRTQVDSHYFDDSLVQFFTPGDEADLARAMVQVYERRAERAAWTASARRFAEANSWQERVGDYLRVFDGLVSPDQVAPR